MLDVFQADLAGLAVTLNLGRPAVSNGICVVDVSLAVAALASGSYVIFVRALDDDTGLFSSAATTTFTR